MRSLSRTALLVACASALAACDSSTAPSSHEAENSQFPTLVDAGGHLLSPMRLVVVAAADDPLRDSLFAFARALPSSRWWADVAPEFDLDPAATAVTVGAAPIAQGTQLGFSDVVSYVQHAAIDSAGYTGDGHTVYLIFLPPGVTCTVGGSCSVFSSFHVPFGTSNAFAVVTRLQGGAHSMLEAMTLDASHEIVESATDPEFNGWRISASAATPWTTSPWALDDGGTFEENADICAGTRYLEGGFYYQRIFTNRAGASGGDPCAPAIASPFYSVKTDKPWYTTTTGEIAVPVTGWSTGAVGDWVIGASLGPRTTGVAAPTLQFTCPDTITVNTTRLCSLNDGRTANLHITLPLGAGPGTYFSIRILSGRFDGNGQLAAPGEDYTHRAIFGVYVPQ